MHFYKCWIFYIFLLIYSAVKVDCYKYLAVLQQPDKSHFIVGSTLMKALAQKGHEVYVISMFPQNKKISNYHDITLSSLMNEMKDQSNTSFTVNDKNVFMKLVTICNLGLRISEMVLKDPNVQKLMASHVTFDAVIFDVLFTESLFGLSEHFKAPLIGLAQYGASAWNTEMVGSPSPPSYVPSIMLRYSDHMCLVERVRNLGYLTAEKVFMEAIYLPRQVRLYNKYFGHVKRDMYTVRSNAAAVLVNTHVSLGYPRPYVPNQIEIGSLHINRERKPLPEAIEKFIKASKHGVVYFSMGSQLKSKDLPASKKNEFLKAFKQLKQGVLWKYEDEMLEDKPDNVLISDWFPQNDILAHENVKVFITQGGILSVIESAYHGTPVIGIPIHGNQFLHTTKAVKKGYGLKLDFQSLTAADIVAAVEHIISNKNYTERAKKISESLKDQPVAPLDLAVFWVEHIARHKGAKYLHCAGLDLTIMQYHSLDVMLTLCGVILIIVYFCFSLAKRLAKKVFK